MHAAVRYQIATHGRWNPAWDRPINQEDLAGTLLAFSWVCLDGLRQMGFQLSADKAICIAGTLSGISWAFGKPCCPRMWPTPKRWRVSSSAASMRRVPKDK